MWKLHSILSWAGVAALLLCPVNAFAVSGSTPTPYTYAGLNGNDGYGWIEVRFKNTASEAYGTQWRLITSAGPVAPWRNVLKAGQTDTVTKLAITYGIEFQRMPTTPAATKPPTTTVTVAEDQKVTVWVLYN